jgi:hypothetical protein
VKEKKIMRDKNHHNIDVFKKKSKPDKKQKIRK